MRRDMQEVHTECHQKMYKSTFDEIVTNQFSLRHYWKDCEENTGRKMKKEDIMLCIANDLRAEVKRNESRLRRCNG